MEKYFLCRSGSCTAFCRPTDVCRKVPFPIQIQVSSRNDQGTDHADFLLNASRGGVYIPTDRPRLPGTVVRVAFYIPPHAKVLADFVGLVAAPGRRRPAYPGMLIKFIDFGHQEMHNLLAYLEGRKHLVDLRE